MCFHKSSPVPLYCKLHMFEHVEFKQNVLQKTELVHLCCKLYNYCKLYMHSKLHICAHVELKEHVLPEVFIGAFVL